MKRLLLGLGLLLGLVASAAAQVPCVGVGGVNTVPQVGVDCLQEPAVASYAASSVGLVPVAAGATDFFCIGGSANRVIRLQRVRVSGTATTIVTVPLLITKHTSLDTGAASATGAQIPVPYPFDSNFPAATATTRAWITANPTIVDAAPGIIASQNLQLNLPAAVGNTTSFDWEGRNTMSAITLRKATEEVCLNLNTTAITGGLIYATIVWTESLQ